MLGKEKPHEGTRLGGSNKTEGNYWEGKDLVRKEGFEPLTTIESAQLIHSTFRHIRKNRQNRMSEVHRGYTKASES